jgi:histidyl-tRNA synthetase
MFETLPGFREFYPEQFACRRGLFDTWKETLESCGFFEYDSAVLEPLELYIEKSGNEIVEQLFHFVDKGNRKVALRPEMTPSLARMVGSRANALRRPVKWFNIGDHFRYERMQKGRTRCFTQLNVDILGEAGVIADVESIYTLVLVCKQLGLNASQFYVRLSDRDIWLLVFEAIAVVPDAQAELLGVIDKFERMSEEQVKESITKILGNRSGEIFTAIREIFEIKSIESLKKWFLSVPDLSAEILEKVQKRLEEWSALTKSLDELGCAEYYEIDLSIVRGLAYYTGFVFEAFERGRRSRALAGGGRYDHLIRKLGGPDFPAVGWAMGDVTMMDCLEFNCVAPNYKGKTKAFAVLEPDTREVANEDINRLREAGIAVVFSYKKDTGFGKQFKEANQQECRYAFVYGRDEVLKGEVLVKDLETGKEESISRMDLIDWLKNR